MSRPSPTEPTPIQAAIETLSEELAQRKAADEAPVLEAAIWTRYRLGPKPAALLAALFKRPMLSRETAAMLLYSYRDGQMPSTNLLDQHMVPVRRALTPDGVFIDCVWKRGWLMDDKNKARLRERLGL